MKMYPVYIRVMAMVMLFAMFHYVAGYRLMYSLGIIYAKEQAKESMKEKNGNIKTITLSTTDYNSLKWSEENKEFSYNSEMYDAVSIQKSGNTYTISAYGDDFETECVTVFHHVESELFHPDQSSKGSKSAEDVMSAFQKDCTPATEFKIQLFSLSGLLQPYSGGKQYLPQVSDNIWHPPVNC